MPRRPFRILCASLLGCILAAPRLGAGEGESARKLIDLSLGELAQLEVTSVSKRPESRARAAAAIHVITGEDIRRSGATTLAEALRLASGVQVSRIDGNQ